MIATEVNILPFYTALSLQHHNKWYGYGAYYCMPTPAGFLVPFQLRREQTGAAITELVVVEVATGTETDILATANASGLEVVQYVADGYDLVIFPATLSVGSFNVGRHYLRMADGANTWYSEVFNFVSSTAGLVKIEWWHDGDFCYPSGKLRYNYPYKSRVYLDTDIGKPLYPFQEEVRERNGKAFKLKQISAKQYRFSFTAPEYIFDALRLAGLHDFLEITNYNDSRTHTVDEFNMEDPEWLEQGDLGNMTIEFQTDTVVVKSGSGVSTLTYEAGPGECLPVDYTAVAHIVENSLEYNGLYYVDSNTGDNVAIVDEDYVLVTEFASPYKKQLYRWSDFLGFVLVSNSDDEVVYVANDNAYYFYDTDQFISPVISSISGGIITGKTFPNTLAAIYSYDGSMATLLDTIPAAALEAGAAITVPGGSEFVYFVVQTPACPALAQSTYFRTGASLIGVGYDTVEDDLIVY